jgi:hypothetical protein
VRDRAARARFPPRRSSVRPPLAALAQKLLDPDEKVRAAVCRLFAQLEYETALHHVSDTLLRAVGARALDKRASVRAEALGALGRLYSLAYPEMCVPLSGAPRHAPRLMCTRAQRERRPGRDQAVCVDPADNPAALDGDE